ncbi:MAG TPA: flagellar filament capping protein FliD [Allosphingosinicella sp.]|jgi:flagellar hook-associated protein 2|nr:flagellar filament capping protein FliD [Allosphingosinicella sp.]
MTTTSSAASATSTILTSIGVGSGIDVTSLVSNLVAADRAPKDAAIQARQTANTAQISSLADVANGIDSFASALTTLVSGGTLFSQPSVSDTSVLNATAVAGKPIGNLNDQLEVVQLAQSQSLQSVAVADPSASIGQGDLTLNTAAGSFAITVDSSNDSLNGLAAAINAKNAGVTASVVTDSSGSRLVMKGATGAANAFTLSVPAGTSSGLERFAYDPNATGGMTLAQGAQDAIVKLDGVQVNRATNSFSDLIAGVQIDLKHAAPGEQVSLGVTRPSAAIEQAVTDFVAAYNQMQGVIAKATAAGGNGQASGPLHNDLSVRQMQQQLAQLPSMTLSSVGSIKTLAEIGVSTNRDGTLSVDTTRLETMLAQDPDGVEGLFNPTQYSSDPNVTILSAIGKTKPGTYTVTNLVPAVGSGDASGMIDGLAALAAGPNLIAPSKSDALGLILQVGGPVASATITIDPGLGGAVQAIRDSLRALGGPIQKSQDALDAATKQIADDQAALDTKESAYSDRLTTQYSAMDMQVAQFKATQSYLDQQIKMWTNGNNNN